MLFHGTRALRNDFHFHLVDEQVCVRRPSTFNVTLSAFAAERRRRAACSHRSISLAAGRSAANPPAADAAADRRDRQTDGRTDTHRPLHRPVDRPDTMRAVAISRPLS